MLRIREIRIRNFRSIRDETFALPELTILVGKNDVGKSNLLESIKILLEGRADSVDTEDYYDPAMPIEIEAVFEGARDYLELCDTKNRTKIEQRLDRDGLLTIRRVASVPPKLEKIEIRDPADGQFGTPTGIDAALKPMLPEVIFIEALADVADETKGKKEDALGKLVGQVVSSITESIQPALDRAYSDANRLLNVRRHPTEGTEQDERVRELSDIEGEITRYLRETFPSSAVRLKVQLPSVKDLLAQINVFVREGSHEDPYYRRGHGLQRTLYLSLLRALAGRIRQVEGQAVARPFILLFEEPEAFLHPEGQIKMRNALSAIATAAQVLIATHSPVIVTPDSVSRTVRVEKRAEPGFPRPITRRFGPLLPTQLSEFQRQLLPLFEIQRSSRFLFSRGVLLVEGIGDEYLFSSVAERLRQFKLEANEIAVVETGGKDRILAFGQILRLLGLRVWALVDLDFLWNGAGAIFGADADYSQFVQTLNGLVPPLPDGTRDEARRRENRRQRTEACTANLAGQRDALCDRLIVNEIFVLRFGEIEDYVGLGQTSKGQYLRAANEIRSGTRNIENQRDFEILLDAFRAWALAN